MKNLSTALKLNNYFRALAVLLVFLLTAVSSWADQSLSISSLKFPEGFNLQSAYYTVEPQAVFSSEPGFLKFKVTTGHAVYEVEGLLPFKKVLLEAEVIEKIRSKQEGSGFVDGAVDSVKGTGQGFVNLVTHPVRSGKAMGGAVGKLGRTVGGMFRSKEEGEKTTFSEAMLGGSKRELANRFGVDVYSDNPYLQEVLNRMAKSRLGGKGATAVATLLIPFVGVVAIALTASNVNKAADLFVADKSKAELFRSNKIALEGMGFTADEINVFLNNANFSPREATYIRFYLEKMIQIQGYREIMRRASAASSLIEARKLLWMAQMVADSINEETQYSRLQFYPLGLAAEQGDKLIYVTPYDYLDKSPFGDQVMQELENAKINWQKETAQLWNAGEVTLGFSTPAFLKRIKTRSWALFKTE